MQHVPLGALPKTVTLSPSDFAFLYEECRTCYRRKVLDNDRRPSAPFPKVFTLLDSAQKNHFSGGQTQAITPTLPPGQIVAESILVESAPIHLPGRQLGIAVRGFLDTLLVFDDETYGIADFKTAEPRSTHLSLYSRQLHAYAWATEHPAPGRLKAAPVTRLGLFVFQPQEMLALADGRFAFAADPLWVEVPRDDEIFVAFLDEVVELLEGDPPDPSPNCPWCAWRLSA